ncbi:hypothetical protein BGW38_008524 [Lunasporangiospora selenospora]|uniref:poly(ADP-ribose) glycohydrolase n=1 Tax=Lunasporangiospora selenospora TaxID=979761 RepID=A0A9P6KIG2_9FUNG|nr:hypothetical protein BGW38_008524 [Lunasporangiospora selenospora]
MSGPSPFFETGPHHVLCKIPDVDPVKHPYPRDYQDSWDREHVRLPCSNRTPYAVPSRWADIVLGLSGDIKDSRELVRLIAKWDGSSEKETSRSWNALALNSFLNAKADRQTLADRDVSGTRSHFFEAEFKAPHTLDEDDTSSQFGETSKIATPEGSSYDHDEELLESQFLDAQERERFFNVILPRMQKLALRIPELIKKPIPFLNQQQDAALTLSQEQIACLLANAFFCTFPCRNTLPYDGEPGSARKRRRSFSGMGEKKHETNQRSGTKGHETKGRGQMLGTKPKDPFGQNRNTSKPRDALRNSQGQMSLFAYFNKKEPVHLRNTSDSAKNDTFKKSKEEAISLVSTQETMSLGTQSSLSHDDKTSRESSFWNSARISFSTTGSSMPSLPSQNSRRSKDETPFVRCPSINFSTLFASDDPVNPCTSTKAAKLRLPQGFVTFHRQVLKTPVTLDRRERINDAAFQYIQVQVDRDSPLEDDAPLGSLQLDFANKNIGGGVLGRGAVQEEILFVICPELIISRLFVPQLQDNEALLIKGAERYSNYNGYASTFEWHSNHIDNTPSDMLNRRKREICAIDAVPFKTRYYRLAQFKEESILREFNKALVGFRRSPITASEWGMTRPETGDSTANLPLIATGNWGCGAFGGHLQLKFMIQFLAASVCEAYSKNTKESGSQSTPLGRDMAYYTYGLDDLATEIEIFVEHLQATANTIDPGKSIKMT